MILGVDPGTKRVGVAVADQTTRFARPLEVIEAAVVEPAARIATLVRDLGVTTVVVGRPVGLSGHETAAMDAQRLLLARLRDVIDVRVVEHDERLTTVLADQGLRAAGGRRAARDALRDAVAAQVMLQSYLDADAAARRREAEGSSG